MLNKICEEKKRDEKPTLEGEERIEYNKMFKRWWCERKQIDEYVL